MKIRSKIAFTAGLVGLFASVAGVANAGYINKSYNMVMPVAQIPNWTSYDLKVVTNASGYVRVSTVGASYSVDHQMCTSSISCSGNKVLGLYGGDSAWLLNSYPAGDDVRMEGRVGSFNAVKVLVTGVWRGQ